MRRELTVLMAAMITVCGLAGCGGKTPAASAAAPAETTAAAKGADSDWYMEALTDAALKEKYPYHCFADVYCSCPPRKILLSAMKTEPA